MKIKGEASLIEPKGRPFHRSPLWDPHIDTGTPRDPVIDIYPNGRFSIDAFFFERTPRSARDSV